DATTLVLHALIPPHLFRRLLLQLRHDAAVPRQEIGFRVPGPSRLCDEARHKTHASLLPLRIVVHWPARNRCWCELNSRPAVSLFARMESPESDMPRNVAVDQANREPQHRANSDNRQNTLLVDSCMPSLFVCRQRRGQTGPWRHADADYSSLRATTPR